MNVIRVVVLGLFAATLGAGGQTIQVSKDNRTIAITTTDEAEAVADRAAVSIGYTLYGTDQDGTYAEASKTSNAIMKSLKAAGIKDESVESREQNIAPIDDNDKARYTRGIRFIASQSWTVTVRAKDAADTLHVAITAGANNSGGIDWQLADVQALQSDAATRALVHAQQIAEGMAKGLHTTLGPLVYASNEAPAREDRTYGGLVAGVAGVALMKAAPPPKPLAISPAKITKSATVYAVFSLQ